MSRGRLLGAVIGVVTMVAPVVVSAEWVDATAHDGIAYFLVASPGEIERYDMAQQVWLPAIPVSTGGTAMTVGSSGIFLGFGRRIARVPLAGGPEQHLTNTAGDVHDLVLAGPLIAAVGAMQGLLSLDSSTGALLDVSDGYYARYGLSGLSAAPGLRRVFGRSQGLSPSDIVVETLGSGGTFTGETDSPYHGAYPSAWRTFVFPGEARVADDAGIVYTTNALAYAGSLAGALTDLAFYGDLPIVLRNDGVVAYDRSLRELGRHAVMPGATRIFVQNATIFAFGSMATGIGVESIPVSALTTVVPGTPVDPTGLPYAIDGFAQSPDGTIYLLSSGNLSIFRWLPSIGAYGATIPLREAPLYLAYSPTTNRLYVAYPSGMITQIDLDSTDEEMPFATSPQTPCGLATAGEFVFVCDPSGAWVSHFTYAPSGELLSQVEWNYVSNEYVWSPELHRMYFFRDDTSPNDLLWEEIDVDGYIGTERDSPYHGDFVFRHPIRLGPGSTSVLTGEGLFFDPMTLVHTASLSNRIDDALWMDGTLVTIRRLLPERQPYEPQEPGWGVTEVQAWDPDGYSLLWSRQISGLPRRLAVDGATPIVVTSVAGVPRFTRLTCGDAVVDAYEQCDGPALAGQSCATLGLGTGSLACTDACSFDVAGCSIPPRCGDGVVDQASETCDGADLGAITSCTEMGFAGGSLACTADCGTYDTNGCNACGNGVVDGSGEECDGDDLGHQTCDLRGFPGGTLSCRADCTIDDGRCTRDCQTQPCEPDGDPCTVDRCSESGCIHEAIADCQIMRGYLVVKGTATVHRGGLTGDCTGRCGDLLTSSLVLGGDATYRIPSEQPTECPGEPVVIPDETGTIKPRRRHDVLRPSNLDEIIDAVARCGGVKTKAKRYKAWIRRDGDTLLDGRSVLVTKERHQGVGVRVRLSARLAAEGQQIEAPRRFERLASCADGLRLRCRAR